MIKFYEFPTDLELLKNKRKLKFDITNGLREDTSSAIIESESNPKSEPKPNTKSEPKPKSEPKINIRNIIILKYNYINIFGKTSLIDQCFNKDDIILTDPAGLDHILEMDIIGKNHSAGALSEVIYNKIYYNNSTIKNTIKTNIIFNDIFYDKSKYIIILNDFYKKYLTYNATDASQHQYAVYKKYKNKNEKTILNIIHAIGPDFNKSNVCINIITEITNITDINNSTNIYKLFYTVYRSIYVVFNDIYILDTKKKLYMVPFSTGVFSGKNPNNIEIILYTILLVLSDLNNEFVNIIPYLFITPELDIIIKKYFEYDIIED